MDSNAWVLITVAGLSPFAILIQSIYAARSKKGSDDAVNSANREMQHINALIQGYVNQVKGLEEHAARSDKELRELRADYWVVWDKAESNARLYEQQKFVTDECERKAEVLLKRVSALEAKLLLLPEHPAQEDS